MEKIAFEEMLALEEKHWWFLARKKIINSLINKYLTTKMSKILEIGIGSGLNLKWLKNYGTKLTGVDSSTLAITAATNKILGTRLFQCSFPDCDLKEKFDLICLFDVLEHIKEEPEAMKKLSELLTEGGKIILTVPAYNFLFSRHDVVNHHQRRYTKKSLKKLITQHPELKIEFLSYFNFFLAPFIITLRLIKKFQKSKSSDTALPPPWLNNILEKIFSSETKLLKNFSLPWGISLICIITK